MDKKLLQCDMSNVTISTDPNKMFITGCITKIGSPSDGAPCGSDGRRVMFTPESIEACGQSWVSSPVNAESTDEAAWWWENPLSGHSNINIGTITKVWAEDDNCMAKIVVWKDKYPEIADLIVCGMASLGFSIECYLTKEHDADGITVIDEFEGCGCAILWKSKAAFEDTFISQLAAARQKGMEDMAEKNKPQVQAAEDEQLEQQTKAADDEQQPEDVPADDGEQKEDNPVDAQAIADAVSAALAPSFEALTSALAGLTEAMTAKGTKCADDENTEDNADDDKDGEEETQAANAGEPTQAGKAQPKDVPAPKTQLQAAQNPAFTQEDSMKSEIEKINASNMSLSQKVKEITKLRLSKNKAKA